MRDMRSYDAELKRAHQRRDRYLAPAAALLLSFLATPSSTGQARVELELTSDNPYVNEAVAVSVAVINAGEHEPPRFPDLPNCTVRERGSGMSSYSNVDSRTGRAIRALSSGATMPEAMGISTFRAKLTVFVIAAVLAAISGWLFAYFQRTVNPSPFAIGKGNMVCDSVTN